jgi:transcriptional regulator with XRE-family HTH domain
MRPSLRVTNTLGEILASRGLSYATLAELTGIPYRRVLRIAQRRSNPPLRQALEIAAVLDLPIERFFRLRATESTERRRRRR